MSQEKAKILHLGAGVIYGGVESFLASIARYSTETDPSFVLCSEGRLQLELLAANRQVEVLPQVRLSRPWLVHRARRALNRFLDQHEFDIAQFHSAWVQILFAPVLRRRNIPFTVWIHGVSSNRNWVERLARRHSPLSVFTASHFLADVTKEWYPGVPRQLIAIPVAKPPLVTNEQKLLTRQSLNTDSTDIVIMISCRFEPWKGHELLFRALALLKDLPGWTLWVAGGAQEPHELRRLELLHSISSDCGIANRIRFLGQRTDVPTLLQSANIHCQPNPEPEPFGIAFVEALYAGLPVVSTSIGGALEIIDPTCGILVPPGDIQSLADALRKLITAPELRVQLGNAGPRRAIQLCDPRQQIAALESGLIAALES